MVRSTLLATRMSRIGTLATMTVGRTFKEHVDDFLEIVVEFIERFTLTVRSWAIRYVTDIEACTRATLHDGGIGLHALLTDSSQTAPFYPSPVAAQPVCLCTLCTCLPGQLRLGHCGRVRRKHMM